MTHSSDITLNPLPISFQKDNRLFGNQREASPNVGRTGSPPYATPPDMVATTPYTHRGRRENPKESFKTDYNPRECMYNHC